MKLRYAFTVILSIVLVTTAIAAVAMDTKQETEFRKIIEMPLGKVTELAKNSLKNKYPEEEWKTYNFPDFVFTNESVETGYKIAVKKPHLLAKIPCYCPCDQIGHKNLLDCFLKGGKQGEYDDHASFCLICYRQAMLAFLWADLGATDREMIEAMEKEFRVAK